MAPVVIANSSTASSSPPLSHAPSSRALSQAHNRPVLLRTRLPHPADAPARYLLLAEFEVVADVGLNLTPFRLTYLFFVSLGFCLVAYKMYQLGLLPVTSADWITLLPQHVPPQRIWPAGGFI